MDDHFQAHLEHLAEENLFLIAILVSVLLAIYVPSPGVYLEDLHLTGPFVGLIFVQQGMELDLKELKRIREFLKVVVWAFFLSLVFFPMAAWLVAEAFAMPSDAIVGFLIMCSSPCTLAAGPTIAARAKGDPLAAIVLIISINFAGLFAYPENLKIWIGSVTHVNDIDLIFTLLLYLFVPVMIGQLVRHFFPKLIKRNRGVLRYLPMSFLSLIIYGALSAESSLISELKFPVVVYLFVPSLCVHVFMLALTYTTGKYLWKFSAPINRALTIICSEKPLTLTVAVWSRSFSRSHPFAVFPIIAFYMAQLVTDTIWASRLRRKDGEE